MLLLYNKRLSQPETVYCCVITFTGASVCRANAKFGSHCIDLILCSNESKFIVFGYLPFFFF